MNRQIAKLGVGLLLCFLVLFVQLNRVTVFGAQRLKDNPANNRSIRRVVGTSPDKDEVQYHPFYSVRHAQEREQRRGLRGAGPGASAHSPWSPCRWRARWPRGSEGR